MPAIVTSSTCLYDWGDPHLDIKILIMAWEFMWVPLFNFEGAFEGVQIATRAILHTQQRESIKLPISYTTAHYTVTSLLKITWDYIFEKLIGDDDRIIA